MKQKKLVALLIACSLTLSSVLVGCGNGNVSVETSKTSTETFQSSTTESETEKTVTTVGNGEKLVVAIQSNSLIEDYEDNYLTKKLEEDLNIEIEVISLPSANDEFRTKVAMTLAAGTDLPDVIIGSLSKEAVYDYGNQGYLIDLKQYLENTTISPNWSAISEVDRAKMLQVMTSPMDGNVYGLGGYMVNTWNAMTSRIFINKEWIDTLGLKMPETTDELYEVLKAFANNDPNGNGIKDEIAAYGFNGSYGQNIVWALMNSFVFYNAGKQNAGLALDDTGKKLVAPFVTEEWREGLGYLRKLCQEGLLPEAVFTDDQTQYKAILNAETPIVGLTSSGSLSNWADYENNANLKQLELVAPFAGPDGNSYTVTTESSVNLGYFVTADCKYPELAYRLGEYFYNEEIGLIARFGEKGVDWTNDPEVLKDYACAEIDAGLTENMVLVNYKVDENIWGVPNKQHWHDVGIRYYGTDLGEADRLVAPESVTSSALYKVRMSFFEKYPNKKPEHLLAADLIYTADELETVSTQKSDINTYVRNSAAEFITGQRALDDAGWKEYLETLDELGLQQFIETSQIAYDRMSK